MKEKYCTILFAVKEALGVSLAEYVILDTIFHMENHNKDRGCYAGIDYFSKITDMSERTVQRSMKNLVSAGYIIVEKKSSTSSSRRTTDKYKKMRIDEEMGDKMTPIRGRQNVTQRVTKRHPMGDKMAAPPIYNNNDNNSDNTSGGDPPQEVKIEEIKYPCIHFDKVKGNVCSNNKMDGSDYCKHHAVQEIIDLFKPVNESYLEFYGKKTQHAAVVSLIKTYPKHEIQWMIKTAPAYNKMPYRAKGDKIYTPYDLLKNWSVMKDNLISYKLQKKQKEDATTKEVV